MDIDSIAPIGKRISAGLIDLLIVIIATAISTLVALVFQSTNSSIDPSISDVRYKGIGILCGLLIDATYTIFLLQSPRHSTYGQRAVGIKLYRIDGEKITFTNVLVRYIVSIFSSIFLKLGYLIIFITKYNQTLHDLAVGTTVVEDVLSQSDVQNGNSSELSYLIDYWNSFNNIGKFCILGILVLWIISAIN